MSTTNASLPPKLPPKRVATKQLALVLFPYQGQHKDELTIQEGDIITILSKDVEDVGWWKGELNGVVGVFPDNYVKLIKQTQSQSLDSNSKSGNNLSDTSSLNSSSTTNLHNDSNSFNESKNALFSESPESKPSSVLRSPSESKLNKVLSSLTASSRFNEMLNKSNQNESKAIGSEDELSKSSSTLKSSLQDSSMPTFGSLHNRKPKIRSNKPLCKSESAHEIAHSSSAAIDLNLPDDSGSSKLRHLTASRVKGPRTRRPPSLIHLNQSQDETDDWNASAENIYDEPEMDVPNATSQVNSCSSGNNSRLHSRSNSISESNKSGVSVPPWMLELKRNQEKKNESRKKGFNSGDEHSSNGTTSKTFGVISPVLPAKPNLVQLRNPTEFSSASSASTPNSSVRPAASLSRCNSINNSSTTTIGNGITSTSYSQSDSPVDSSQNNKETQSLNLLSTQQPPPITASKPARAAKPTASKLLQNQSTLNLLSSKDAIDTQSKEPKHSNKSDYVQRKEFDDLQKKVSELTEMLETQKTTYRNLITDIINDLAEEKKKVANLHIEVDRLRKITSTV